MEIMNSYQKLLTFKHRWRQQYAKYFGTEYQIFPNDEPILVDEMRKKIEALPDPPTHEQVEELMRNPNWTKLRCEECNESVNTVVVFDGESDQSKQVCINCLMLAVSLVVATGGRVHDGT